MEQLRIFPLSQKMHCHKKTEARILESSCQGTGAQEREENHKNLLMRLSNMNPD
jgi:hypothetical protein